MAILLSNSYVLVKNKYMRILARPSDESEPYFMSDRSYGKKRTGKKPLPAKSSFNTKS
jgi:hypothetical protein